MTLQKWAIFIMGSMGNFLIFCRIQLKFRFWLYKKNVDTHHENFSSKKQVIKKLSPKSLRQTYMKWIVGFCFAYDVIFIENHIVYGEKGYHILQKTIPVV